jgi:hypothetical protein
MARAPVVVPLPAAPPRLDGEQADLDPDNDAVVAPPDPLAGCSERLERAGVTFRPARLALKSERVAGGKEVIACGAEQVVTYLGGPAKIRYTPPPLLTCRLALALARFEELAQEAALLHLGRRIVRIRQMGTYNCRKMVRFDFVSEHSYANAIDIKELWLEGGRRVGVKEHFGPLDVAPSSAEARFLRSLAERAYAAGVFSVVLTPFWDKLHADHFHLDLARYRVDGSRPQ